MKLFRKATITPLIAVAALLAVLSNPALADRRDRDHGYRDWNHNSSWNRYNPGRGNAHRNNYRNNYSNNYGNFGTRYRPFRSNIRTGHRRDNVYVNVNVGRRYSGWNNRYRNYRPYSRHTTRRYDSGYVTGLAAGTLLTTALSSYYRTRPVVNQTTVVYRQPTVVHVNDSARTSGPVVSGSTGRSLLRDIHGNCYERSYDSRGVETRIELPASACNF